MPAMHHRNPGVIGTLGAKEESQRPWYGIIADGIHVHPSAVRLAYDCHPNGAILVTDGECCATLTDSRVVTDTLIGSHVVDEPSPSGRTTRVARRPLYRQGGTSALDRRHHHSRRKVRSFPLLYSVLANRSFSAISMDHCVRNLAAFTSIPLSKAIRCATWNVAQMLGGEVAAHKGALKAGYDADLVVLDASGVVQSTWVMGKEVWSLERWAERGCLS